MGRAEDKRQAARDAAAHHGLRASVPHYLEAAQALVEIRRPEEAVDLLGELLVAQEKKRGLFGRVEKNPLGHFRSQVAVKFADYSRLAAPTEDVLELLGELALELPDDPTVRRANADALYNAGYIADATEEYRYCLRLNPDDGQILSRLTDAYADMGRNDHAIEFLRRGMRVHAEAKDFGQAMHLAIRWLGMAPGAAEDVIMLLKDWPADALRRQIGGINQLATLVKKDDIHDASWHRTVATEFAALGAGGRPETAEAPAPAVKSDTRPTQPAATTPPIKPAVAQPPAVARPAAASPAPAAGRPAAASEQPRPAQTQRPVAPPEPARPIPVQRPSTIPASTPQRTADSRDVKPAAASATPAPPAAAAPPSRSAPSPAPSMSLPTLEKVLEEADQRKPAGAPPTIGRPAAPPIVSRPPSLAPQARSVPPQAEARPPAPSAPDVKPAEPMAATPAAPAEPKRAVAGGTAAGIKNFARRKAKESYDAGDYAGAIGSLERVARFGADAETLQMLLDCYTRLNQPDDAKRVGMQLADLEVEAGRVEAAVAALTLLAKAVPDPEVLKRRSELMAAKG